MCCAACASAPTATSASSSPVTFIVVFTPVGDGSSFTARLNDQNFTRAGASTASLSPGTYQIAGSFTGGGLTVAFQTLGRNGGVVAGSVRSDAGPTTQVGTCAITYGASADARPFQLEFQVTADAAAACGGPAP